MAGWLNKAELPRVSIFARLVLLTIGFALVLFFQLWGFSIYLAVMVFYCRHAARKCGLIVRDFPLPTQRGGDRFTYGVIIISALTVAAMFFRNSQAGNMALTTWAQVNILSGLPACSSSRLAYLDGFYSCKGLYTGIAFLTFSTPILISACLHDLILFAMARVKLSERFLLSSFVLTFFLALAPIIMSFGEVLSLGYYTFQLIFILLILQLFLALLWLRVCKKG